MIGRLLIVCKGMRVYILLFNSLNDQKAIAIRM